MFIPLFYLVALCLPQGMYVYLCSYL
uniref:Uncharacterized protein n=1 Tax=Arundo donax TaxID=35708 RepID=A0A0A9CIT1_ARUDO